MTFTLTTARERTEQFLADTDNTVWSQSDIAEALRQALAMYNQHRPLEADTQLLFTAAQSNGLFTVPEGATLTISGTVVLTDQTQEYELDISGLNAINILGIWLPYDPTMPPVPQAFKYWPSQKIVRFTDYLPNTGELARIFYTKAHTINGLDGSTITTIPNADESLLIIGTAAFAATSRAVDIAERKSEVDVMIVQQIRAWGQSQLQRFKIGLNQVAAIYATKHGGPAATPPLDRYESNWK